MTFLEKAKEYRNHITEDAIMSKVTQHIMLSVYLLKSRGFSGADIKDAINDIADCAIPKIEAKGGEA